MDQSRLTPCKLEVYPLKLSTGVPEQHMVELKAGNLSDTLPSLLTYQALRIGSVIDSKRFRITHILSCHRLCAEIHTPVKKRSHIPRTYGLTLAEELW